MWSGTRRTILRMRCGAAWQLAVGAPLVTTPRWHMRAFRAPTTRFASVDLAATGAEHLPLLAPEALSPARWRRCRSGGAKHAMVDRNAERSYTSAVNCREGQS